MYLPLHELPIIIISSFLSFLVTLIITPLFNKFMKATGIVGIDIMKNTDEKIPDMGGPSVITGFLLGVFTYVSVKIFTPPGLNGLIYILAVLNTVLIITLIGIFDVLTGLMRQREGEGIFERLKRRGIPAWAYFLLPLPAAIPLMAVKAGESTMTLPFLGRVDFGVFYPLVLVPLSLLCCSNATNFLAGFNGLEAGMGFILHISLGLFALLNGEISASLLSLTFAASLLAFLRYNWYPSKVFPGDLNYTIGALAACVAIIGNIEKFAIIVFMPWIIEAVLKASSGFRAESYGVLLEDGTVIAKGDSIRSLTHITMKLGRLKEYQVVFYLITLEIIVCLTAFLIVPYV